MLQIVELFAQMKRKNYWLTANSFYWIKKKKKRQLNYHSCNPREKNKDSNIKKKKIWEFFKCKLIARRPQESCSGFW